MTESILADPVVVSHKAKLSIKQKQHVMISMTINLFGTPLIIKYRLTGFHLGAGMGGVFPCKWPLLQVNNL